MEINKQIDLICDEVFISNDIQQMLNDIGLSKINVSEHHVPKSQTPSSTLLLKDSLYLEVSHKELARIYNTVILLSPICSELDLDSKEVDSLLENYKEVIIVSEEELRLNKKLKQDRAYFPRVFVLSLPFSDNLLKATVEYIYQNKDI